MSCVVMVANRGYALLSSRRELIEKFLAAGWTVHIVTARDAESRELVDLGVKLQAVDVGRGGLFLLRDILLFVRLFSVYRRFKPALIHHFHAKPVIIGSLAARLSLGRAVKVVNTITGLGHAFIKGGALTQLAGLGYRVSLPWSHMTIFQNRDDQQLFLRHHWVKPEKQCLIAGSGIDVNYFKFFERNPGINKPFAVVMTGRLLGQKGVNEFCEVARRFRKKFPDARFLWAGEEDLQHPDSVSVEWLKSQDCIEYLGRLSDVRSLLYEADVLLFPSYREGVPRSVMEAAATGLPTVAFDVPGVREAVIDGKTGYLVKAFDSQALLEAVEKLCQSTEIYEAFSHAARALAKEKFDRNKIHDAYLMCYRSLGIDIKKIEE